MGFKLFSQFGKMFCKTDDTSSRSAASLMCFSSHPAILNINRCHVDSLVLTVNHCFSVVVFFSGSFSLLTAQSALLHCGILRKVELLNLKFIFLK